VAVPLVAVPHTAPTPSPRHDVELLASQRLDADRAVVVVEVGEDRLVVGLNRALQAASLLGKLKPGEPIPARFVLNETPPVKPTSTRATETGPDEELDQLLDELLGKVRGFKPLAKQSHDT
jgi:flagellar biogenesis protein FliO